MSRAKRYADEDGGYLAPERVLLNGSNWCVVWKYDYDCGDGLRVGEMSTFVRHSAESDVSVATATMLPLATSRASDGTLLFSTLKKAKEAIRAANIELNLLPKNVPSWARIALENGWKPPKGWSA